jgi:hypothetical protein
MKRCNCLRYKDLSFLRKDSSIWTFDTQDGLLVSMGSLYPLVEFDKGKAIPICPYYLYVKDGVRISAAFLKQKDLADDKRELIDIAVKECKNRIDISKHKYIEERHACVLFLYVEKHGIEVTEELFNQFFDFLQIRQKYLDISPCLIIPPIEHDERMMCINEAWLEAFEEYIKETT